MNETELAARLAAEIEDSERTRDVPMDTSAMRANRSEVFTLRLNPDELLAVNAVAEAAGLPPSTLVRAWILDRLKTVDVQPESLRTIVHDEVVAAVREALAS